VCEKAAAALAEQGVEPEVIGLCSLKPFDRDTVLASMRKTGRLVVVTKASGLCGTPEEIAALAADLAFTALPAPVLRLTGPDAPAAASRPPISLVVQVPSGPQPRTAGIHCSTAGVIWPRSPDATAVIPQAQRT